MKTPLPLCTYATCMGKKLPCYRRTTTMMVPITLLKTVLFPDQSVTVVESVVMKCIKDLQEMEDKEVDLLNRWLKSGKECYPMREWDRGKISLGKDHTRFPKLEIGEMSCAVESVRKSFGKLMECIIEEITKSMSVESPPQSPCADNCIGETSPAKEITNSKVSESSLSISDVDGNRSNNTEIPTVSSTCTQQRNDSRKDIQPTNDSSMDAQPTNDSSMDIQPTNDSSMDAQPTNDSSVDTQPTNDSRKDIQPTNDSSMDAQPTNDSSMDIQPTNDSSMDAQPTNDSSMDAQPTNDSSVDAQPTNNSCMDIQPTIDSSMDTEQTSETNDAAHQQHIKNNPVSSDNANVNSNRSEDERNSNLLLITEEKASSGTLQSLTSLRKIPIYDKQSLEAKSSVTSSVNSNDKSSLEATSSIQFEGSSDTEKLSPPESTSSKLLKSGTVPDKPLHESASFKTVEGQSIPDKSSSEATSSVTFKSGSIINKPIDLTSSITSSSRSGPDKPSPITTSSVSSSNNSVPVTSSATSERVKVHVVSSSMPIVASDKTLYASTTTKNNLSKSSPSEKQISSDAKAKNGSLSTTSSTVVTSHKDQPPPVKIQRSVSVKYRKPKVLSFRIRQQSTKVKKISSKFKSSEDEQSTQVVLAAKKMTGLDAIASSYKEAELVKESSRETKARAENSAPIVKRDRGKSRWDQAADRSSSNDKRTTKTSDVKPSVTKSSRSRSSKSSGQRRQSSCSSPNNVPSNKISVSADSSQVKSKRSTRSSRRSSDDMSTGEKEQKKLSSRKTYVSKFNGVSYNNNRSILLRKRRSKSRSGSRSSHSSSDCESRRKSRSEIPRENFLYKNAKTHSNQNEDLNRSSSGGKLCSGREVVPLKSSEVKRPKHSRWSTSDDRSSSESSSSEREYEKSRRGIAANRDSRSNVHHKEKHHSSSHSMDKERSNRRNHNSRSRSHSCLSRDESSSSSSSTSRDHKNSSHRRSGRKHTKRLRERTDPSSESSGEEEPQRMAKKSSRQFKSSASKTSEKDTMHKKRVSSQRGVRQSERLTKSKSNWPFHDPDKTADKHISKNAASDRSSESRNKKRLSDARPRNDTSKHKHNDPEKVRPQPVSNDSYKRTVLNVHTVSNKAEKDVSQPGSALSSKANKLTIATMTATTDDAVEQTFAPMYVQAQTAQVYPSTTNELQAPIALVQPQAVCGYPFLFTWPMVQYADGATPRSDVTLRPVATTAAPQTNVSALTQHTHSGISHDGLSVDQQSNEQVNVARPDLENNRTGFAFAEAGQKSNANNNNTAAGISCPLTNNKEQDMSSESVALAYLQFDRSGEGACRLNVENKTESSSAERQQRDASECEPAKALHSLRDDLQHDSVHRVALGTTSQVNRRFPRPGLFVSDASQQPKHEQAQAIGHTSLSADGTAAVFTASANAPPVSFSATSCAVDHASLAAKITVHGSQTRAQTQSSVLIGSAASASLFRCSVDDRDPLPSLATARTGGPHLNRVERTDASTSVCFPEVISVDHTLNNNVSVLAGALSIRGYSSRLPMYSHAEYVDTARDVTGNHDASLHAWPHCSEDGSQPQKRFSDRLSNIVNSFKSVPGNDQKMQLLHIGASFGGGDHCEQQSDNDRCQDFHLSQQDKVILRSIKLLDPDAANDSARRVKAANAASGNSDSELKRSFGVPNKDVCHLVKAIRNNSAINKDITDKNVKEADEDGRQSPEFVTLDEEWCSDLEDGNDDSVSSYNDARKGDVEGDADQSKATQWPFTILSWETSVFGDFNTNLSLPNEDGNHNGAVAGQDLSKTSNSLPPGKKVVATKSVKLVARVRSKGDDKSELAKSERSVAIRSPETTPQVVGISFVPSDHDVVDEQSAEITANATDCGNSGLHTLVESTSHKNMSLTSQAADTFPAEPQKLSSIFDTRPDSTSDLRHATFAENRQGWKKKLLEKVKIMDQTPVAVMDSNDAAPLAALSDPKLKSRCVVKLDILNHELLASGNPYKKVTSHPDVGDLTKENFLNQGFSLGARSSLEENSASIHCALESLSADLSISRDQDGGSERDHQIAPDFPPLQSEDDESKSPKSSSPESDAAASSHEIIPNKSLPRFSGIVNSFDNAAKADIPLAAGLFISKEPAAKAQPHEKVRLVRKRLPSISSDESGDDSNGQEVPDLNKDINADLYKDEDDNDIVFMSFLKTKGPLRETVLDSGCKQTTSKSARGNMEGASSKRKLSHHNVDEDIVSPRHPMVPSAENKSPARFTSSDEIENNFVGAKRRKRTKPLKTYARKRRKSPDVKLKKNYDSEFRSISIAVADHSKTERCVPSPASSLPPLEIEYVGASKKADGLEAKDPEEKPPEQNIASITRIEAQAKSFPALDDKLKQQTHSPQAASVSMQKEQGDPDRRTSNELLSQCAPPLSPDIKPPSSFLVGIPPALGDTGSLSEVKIENTFSFPVAPKSRDLSNDSKQLEFEFVRLHQEKTIDDGTVSNNFRQQSHEDVSDQRPGLRNELPNQHTETLMPGATGDCDKMKPKINGNDTNHLPKTCSPNYHGILEVDMSAPKEYIDNPSVQSAETPSIIAFVRRRIGYIQIRLQRNNNPSTCNSSASSDTALEQSNETPPRLDVSLLRLRDIAFTLRLNPNVLLDRIVSLKLPFYPQTDFIKSVYANIYDPQMRANAIMASYMIPSRDDLFDHMIHMEDYLRVIIPVFYKTNFNIGAYDLPRYVNIRTYQPIDHLDEEVVKVFSKSFSFNSTLLKADLNVTLPKALSVPVAKTSDTLGNEKVKKKTSKTILKRQAPARGGKPKKTKLLNDNSSGNKSADSIVAASSNPVLQAPTCMLLGQNGSHDGSFLTQMSSASSSTTSSCYKSPSSTSFSVVSTPVSIVLSRPPDSSTRQAVSLLQHPMHPALLTRSAVGDISSLSLISSPSNLQFQTLPQFSRSQTLKGDQAGPSRSSFFHTSTSSCASAAVDAAYNVSPLTGQQSIVDEHHLGETVSTNCATTTFSQSTNGNVNGFNLSAMPMRNSTEWHQKRVVTLLPSYQSSANGSALVNALLPPSTSYRDEESSPSDATRNRKDQNLKKLPPSYPSNLIIESNLTGTDNIASVRHSASAPNSGDKVQCNTVCDRMTQRSSVASNVNNNSNYSTEQLIKSASVGSQSHSTSVYLPQDEPGAPASRLSIPSEAIKISSVYTLAESSRDDLSGMKTSEFLQSATSIDGRNLNKQEHKTSDDVNSVGAKIKEMIQSIHGEHSNASEVEATTLEVQNGKNIRLDSVTANEVKSCELKTVVDKLEGRLRQKNAPRRKQHLV